MLTDATISRLTQNSYSNQAALLQVEELTVTLDAHFETRVQDTLFFKILSEIKPLKSLYLRFNPSARPESWSILTSIADTLPDWAPQLTQFIIVINEDIEELTLTTNLDSTIINHIQREWNNFCQHASHFRALKTLTVHSEEISYSQHWHLLTGTATFLHQIPHKHQITVLDFSILELSADFLFIDDDEQQYLPADREQAIQDLPHSSAAFLHALREFNSLQTLRLCGRFKGNNALAYLIAEWSTEHSTLKEMSLFDICFGGAADLNHIPHMLTLLLMNPHLETLDLDFKFDVCDPSNVAFALDDTLSERFKTHLALKNLSCQFRLIDHETGIKETYLFDNFTRLVDQILLPCLENSNLRALQFIIDSDHLHSFPVRHPSSNEILTRLHKNYALSHIIINIDWTIDWRTTVSEKIAYVTKRNQLLFSNYNNSDFKHPIEPWPKEDDLFSTFIAYVSRDFNALKLNNNSTLSRHHADSSNGSTPRTQNSGVTLLRKSMEQFIARLPTDPIHPKAPITEIWENITSFLPLHDFKSLIQITGGPFEFFKANLTSKKRTLDDDGHDAQHESSSKKPCT
jgi:hypothetical protein